MRGWGAGGGECIGATTMGVMHQMAVVAAAAAAAAAANAGKMTQY